MDEKAPNSYKRSRLGFLGSFFPIGEHLVVWVFAFLGIMELKDRGNEELGLQSSSLKSWDFWIYEGVSS